MPKPCPICIHPSRLAIEQAMMNGRPASEIAKNFGFTYTSRKTGQELGDHKKIANHKPHMKGAYEKAMEGREIQSGLALANRLEQLNEQVQFVLDEARKGTVVMGGPDRDIPLLNEDGTTMKAYDYRLILGAVGQGRRNIALLAELQGAIPDGKDDEMTHLRAILDSPDGRKLLAALDALDGQQDAKVERAD